MTIRIHVTAASIAAAVAAFAAVVPARAGGDKVAFPENHAAGVLFTTVDRPDNKQFREFYTSADSARRRQEGRAAAERHRPDHDPIRRQARRPGQSREGRQRPLHQGQSHRLYGDGKAHGLGRRVPGQHPQRRMGVPGLQGGQEPQHRGQSHGLLQLPQAARQAGFRLPLRQAQGRREIGPAHLVRPEGAENGPLFAQNAGKARRAVPFGREAVTFLCGYRAGGFASPAGAQRGYQTWPFSIRVIPPISRIRWRRRWKGKSGNSCAATWRPACGASLKATARW